MEQKTFFIKTFGCQMNIRDTEIMAQTLSEAGYIESSSMQDVSLFIVNTCSIRAKAEQKVFSLLGSLRKIKRERPDMLICVAGCVAQQEGKNIVDRMPHVDLVIGTQHIYNIPELLVRAAATKTAINLADDYEIPRYVPKLINKVDPAAPIIPPARPAAFGFSKFVTIMQGCNNFCTYCVVPYTRGREISRKASDIIDEVSFLVDNGVSEITLLGQNVNSYGKENDVTSNGTPYSFSSLLYDVAKIDGLKRLRFTTSNPKDLSDELINCFSDIDNLCPQFHLPVQAGSDHVLKRMNRKYTIAGYLEKVSKLKAARPDIAITTDIIVGFPGETEEDFEKTMELLEIVRFHGSFSFKYSDRPGTRATSLDSKITEDVKSSRLQTFQKRQDEISLERNLSYIGQILEILVESSGNESFVGRTATNHIVHIGREQTEILSEPGSYMDVRIVSAGQHSLKAELF